METRTASFTWRGHGLDLDELPGPAEDRHTEQRARRPLGTEDLLHELPRHHEVGVVGSGDVKGRLDDIFRSAASSVESDKQVVEGLAGLSGKVALTDYVSVPIEGACSGCEDHAAGRDHCDVGVRDPGVEGGNLD